MLSSSYRERRGGAEEREVGVCPGEACKVKKMGLNTVILIVRFPNLLFGSFHASQGNLTEVILTMFA